MRRIFIPIIVFVLFYILSSCQESKEDNSKLYETIVSLERQVDSLHVIVANLSAENESLKPKKKGKKTTSELRLVSSLNSSQPIKINESSGQQMRVKQHSASSYSYSGRCMATTKKGSQCKRSARSNGYCWQHGG